MPLFFSSSTDDDEPQRAEALLRQAVGGLTPRPGVQEAIKRRVLRSIDAPQALYDAKATVSEEAAKERIWERIASSISLPSVDLWDRVRTALTPSGEPGFLRGNLLPHLRPIPTPSFTLRLTRWTAAFALVLLAVRISPVLFLAPQSRAESSVLFRVEQGEAAVLRDGLWQPVKGEVELRQSAVIRTEVGGRATLIVHDDGVLRLGPSTSVSVNDLSDRPRHGSTPTFVLESGTLWVQALLPDAVAEGWTVAVPGGDVLVNEGSVSLASQNDSDTEVAVWDRLARIDGTRGHSLVAGEGTRLSSDAVVRTLSLREETNPWVIENLKRDAVHRKEIAVLQRERLAKSAGILPTSPIYPVKRVAEAVDVLFTFGQEAKVQKLIGQANTRLNEAAALLASGSGTEAAKAPLEEYRKMLLAVATGSGQGSLQLVQDRVAEEAADVAATLPGDDAYLVKQTILETSAALPESLVKQGDVEGVMLVDTLVALAQRAEDGDVAGASESFKALLPSIQLIDDPSSVLSAQVRKEAKAALMAFAQTMEREVKGAGSGASIAADIVRYLPVRSSAVSSLTDEQVDTLVQQTLNRIFLYRQPRSRYNQLLAEFHTIEQSADRGRILRRLYKALPEDGLARYVRTEFQKVREEVSVK